MKTLPPSGEQLVADYQTAFVAVATAQIANEEATRSEDELMQQLSDWSRGGFLQPGAIDEGLQQNVSHASLDAHVKKVQAQQVEDMKLSHLQELGENVLHQFVGKKIKVDVIAGAEPPIDVLWFSPNTGYRSNVLKKTRITGRVKEIALDKNILLIEPPRLPKILNKDLTAYAVYVISPATAQPAVKLTF